MKLNGFKKVAFVMLGFNFLAPVQGRSELSTGLGDHVIAAVTLKKGTNIGAKCGFSQQIQTIQIFADGSGLSYQHSRGTSCSQSGSEGRGLTLQAGISFPPQPFKLKAEEMDRLLTYLRQQQNDAFSRNSGDAVTSWVDLHTHEETLSLSISVSDDRVGSKFPSELPRAVDISGESQKIGAQIIAQIFKVRVEGSL